MRGVAVLARPAPTARAEFPACLKRDDRFAGAGRHREEDATFSAENGPDNRPIDGDLLLTPVRLTPEGLIRGEPTYVRLYISATDAKQWLAALLNAAQREPVVIRRQKRDVAVLISADEYDRLRGLNVAEFQEFWDRVGRKAEERGLTEKKLSSLLADNASRTRRR